jgi:membrane associated rhomboid family serine protease
VGVQCVDCVKEQAKTIRSAQTVFGGRADNPGLVTKVLIGICVVVYAGQLAIPGLTQRLAFGPAIGWSEPWRALTAAFLHSPNMVLHIAFNMLCLWQIGPYLESLLGRVRFLMLYLISAVGGSAGVVLLAASPPGNASSAALDQYQGWFSGVVGASGAVFGLFAALLILNRHLGRSTAGIGLTIVINAVFGFVYPGISWQAHLGGFVTGLACAAAIAAFSARERRRFAIPALVGVLAVVVAVTAVKYAMVTPLYR